MVQSPLPRPLDTIIRPLHAVINGSITETIPSSICNLKNLTHIDLQWNYIPGPFHTLLYNCSNLQYLDLSFNYFVGTVSDDINRLFPQLRVLNLLANNFTGDIPAAIGRLPSLRSLQLVANLFNGSFPPQIGDLLNLEELSLNYNGFAPQSIPSTFINLKKLRNLWMTETNLIGEIPDNIGNMSAGRGLHHDRGTPVVAEDVNSSDRWPSMGAGELQRSRASSGR